MYINLGLMEYAGVQAFAQYEGEAVIASLVVPDTEFRTLKRKCEENRSLEIIKESKEVAKVNFSEAFIAFNESIQQPIKGKRIVYISNRASLKNADVKRQYFLIKDNKEVFENKEDKEKAILEELKNQFFTKALSKLPLPIHDDWKVYVWEKIKKNFTEIPVEGKLPYMGIYALDIPNVAELSDLVEMSHKSFEFKQKFGRVPQLKSVISIADVEGFNFKGFQQFLKAVGGKDEMEKIPYAKQCGMLRAFEVLGAEEADYIIEEKNYWYTTSIKVLGVMLRNTKDKNEKQKIKNTFKKAWGHYKGKIEDRSALIGNFKKIYAEKAEAIKNGDFDAIKKFLDEIQYENVEPGAEEMASVCSKQKLSQEDYKKHELAYLDSVKKCRTSAKEYPTLSNQFSKDYFWEIIDMAEPRAWMVGLETNCCQHLGSVGGACVKYAAANPSTAGILRITKKGKVVAQSFVWLTNFRQDGTRGFVFDNIETLRTEVDDTLYNIYKEVGEYIKKYKDVFRISTLTIGTGYLTVDLKNLPRVNPEDKRFGKIPSSLGYTDARHTQYVLEEFKVKMSSFTKRMNKEERN